MEVLETRKILCPCYDLNSGLSSLQPSYCTDYTTPVHYIYIHFKHMEYICPDVQYSYRKKINHTSGNSLGDN
jgi:ferredoxin-thioredoxin reductase catalytic subunit